MAGIVFIPGSTAGISKIKENTKTNLSGVITGDGATIGYVPVSQFTHADGSINFTGIQSYESSNTFLSGNQVVDKNYVDTAIDENINEVSGSVVELDTTNFDGILSATDTQVQRAFDTVDDITTTDVPEGTNEYFTQARSRESISENILGIDYNNTTGVFSLDTDYVIPQSTTDIPEGTNEYFNLTRARESISENITGMSYDSGTGVFSLDTDYVIPQDTSDIPEGSNLYYTDGRAKSAFTESVIGLDYNSGTGDLSLTVGYVIPQTTSDVPEGSNEYFTEARARESISETVLGLDYDNTSGVISLTDGYVIPTTTDEINWNDAVSKEHDQNTDTGTTEDSFVLDSDGASPIRFKNDAGVLRLRNNADDDDVDLVVENLTVNGTQTIIHSTVLEVDDNTITVNAGVSGTPTLDGGLIVKRGIETNSSILWNEVEDNWYAGLLGAENIIWTAGTDGAGSGLDADLLDGHDSSYFTPSGHAHIHNELDGLDGGTTDEYYHLTETQHTDLTDGGDTTLHTHDIYSLADGSRNYSGKISYDTDKTFTDDKELVAKKYVDDSIENLSGSLESSIDSSIEIAVENLSGSVDATYVKLVDYEDLDVLNKVKNVDGAGSGLDADLWDGNEFADYLDQAVKTTSQPSFVQVNIENAPVLSGEVATKDYTDTQDMVIPSIVSEPTGFESRTTSTISFNDGTLTFTITPTVTTFNVWMKGVKFEKEESSVILDGTTGLWFIYFLTDGTLSAGQSAWIFVDGKAPVATVYWNGVTGLLGDERHGIIMDGQTHDYLHHVVGVRYRSGLTGSFTDTTFSISDGIIYDEDIENVIPTTTSCRVFYREAGIYNFTASQTKWYVEDTNILQWDNAGTLQDVDNNKYMAMWFFATNDPDNPIYVLTGQSQDTKLKDARANNKYESLVLLTLPSQEMKLLYRVILRRSGTNELYVEAQDLRSVSNLPAGTYVASVHGNLSGLLDDDHTQYLLEDGTRLLTADWDAGSFKITAETLESDVTTGTPAFIVASTTLISNLNADLLDGQHGNYYASQDALVGISGSIITDHGDLSGLDGDDHTQYSLATGTRDFTGIVQYDTDKTFTDDKDIIAKKYVDDEIAGLTSDHEELTSLLGGAEDDHYHLTGVQQTALTSGNSTTLHDHDKYSLADGTRDFTGKISYDTDKTFSDDKELIAKKYVDDEIAGLTSDHEELTSLLGGSVGNHYHLTDTQLAGLTSGESTELHSHAGGSGITSGSVSPYHLNDTNSPTSGQIPSYDPSGKFTWVDDNTTMGTLYDYTFLVLNGIYSYSLPLTPISKKSLLVAINGVILHPNDYLLSGSVATFVSGAVQTDDNAFVKIIDPAIEGFDFDEAPLNSTPYVRNDGAWTSAETTLTNSTDKIPRSDAVYNAISDNTPIGSVVLWPVARSIPTNWKEQNGDPISRSTYSTLFGITSTDYGVGDGSTTFNLPDTEANGSFIRHYKSGTSAAIGTLQPDQMQGSSGQIRGRPDDATASGTWYNGVVQTTQAEHISVNPATQITDGVNGTPRTGTTTYPYNLAMIYIIKVL